MLSVGDLLWVPFTYSTTARYLALHPTDLGLLGTAGILAVQLIGYTIFRGSNNEKNEFRKGNNPKSRWLLMEPACYIRDIPSLTCSSISLPYYALIRSQVLAD